ncbi:MAG TPA: cupin domain-containing protein [Thermoanaerobaculia bacterium]|nr:cupin domain-containing protein [Thermoanaerobaculia bacterium]
MVPPAGSEVSLQRYRSGELAIDKAYEAVSDGYSLILNQLEKTWPPLAPLVTMLGEVFCARIGVNAYLTPVGSKAFPVHVDNQDGFILQVYGEKVWQLYELQHLPVPSQSLEYKEDLDIPPLWDNLGKSRKLTELSLRAGDILYIPRGMPHCAVARDAPSLHLTVSLSALYWLDFFKAAVEQASFAVHALRRAVPPRFVSDPGIHETMRSEFDALLGSFQAEASFEATLAAVMRRRIRVQGYPQDGHLPQLLSLGELTQESLLERRSGLLCMVDCAQEGTCRIRFGGGYVQGPARLRQTFEFVRDHPRFRVAELPGLDAGGRIILARRLVRLGLLRPVGGQESEVPQQAALSIAES